MSQPNRQNDASSPQRAAAHRVAGCFVAGDVTGEHECPACGCAVKQIYRAGRARIYCTQACRQTAYRRRRAAGVRLCVERNGPTSMLHNQRIHAVRDQRDPTGAVRDRRQRHVSVCGTFANSLANVKRTHYEFLPASPTSCTTCAALVNPGSDPPAVPEAILALGVPTWWPDQPKR